MALLRTHLSLLCPSPGVHPPRVLHSPRPVCTWNSGSFQPLALTTGCSHTAVPSWRSLKRASAWPSPTTGWFPAARCSSFQAGQGCEAPAGGCVRCALGEVKADLLPAVPALGVRSHGHPSCHVFMLFLLSQGDQDHGLPALQSARELMSVLLGISLSGPRLHSLGLRWCGKQVSQSSSWGRNSQSYESWKGVPSLPCD